MPPTRYVITISKYILLMQQVIESQREKLNMSAEESDESDSDNDNSCNYSADADNVEH